MTSNKNQTAFGRRPGSMAISALPALVALFLGLTWFGATAAHAQSASVINQALADLYPGPVGTTGTNYLTASATDLENAMKLISSPHGTTVTVGTHSASGFGDAAYAAQDVGIIMQGIVTASGAKFSSATTAADLIAGFAAGVSGSTALLTSYLPAVTGSAVTYSFYQASFADSIEKTLVGDALKDAPTQLSPILLASLAVSDPSPTAQASLFIAVATANNIADVPITFPALAANLTATTDIGGGVLTSSTTGAFLEAVLNSIGGANQQGFLAAYTAGATPGALATTATNIIKAAPTSFSSASRVNVFAALVTSGTTGGAYTLGQVIPGIVTGILTGQDYTASPADDTARASLISSASGIINLYPSEAAVIASAAASTLYSPATDGYAFAKAVMANTSVKAAFGTNGIDGVTEAIANTFTLSDITASTGNIVFKEQVAQAGLGALTSAQVTSGSAAAIVADVANQILTAPIVSNSTASLDAFAKNFITGVDNPLTGDASLSVSDRAFAAVGLAEAFVALSDTSIAVDVVSSAVATDDTTTAKLLTVAEPILTYLSTNNGATLTGEAADAIAKTAGTSSNPAITYTPAYLEAQLMTSVPKVSGSLNTTEINEIAYGVSTDPAVQTVSYASKDAYLTALIGYISSSADLPYLKDVVPYLVTNASYNDVSAASDVASSSGAPVQSGTIAALLTATHQTDAAAIAYAAAAGSGIANDSARYTIAEDVFKNAPTSDTLAISGSVGTLVGLGTSTSGAIADKGTLAEDLIKLDGTGTNEADAATITLGVANGVSANDPTITTDLGTITKLAIAGFSTTIKTSTNVASLVDSVAFGYTAAYQGGGTLGGYTAVANYAANVLSGETGVVGLSDQLAAKLVPDSINANSDNPVTAQSIASYFYTELPKSPLAIATAATESSLYTSSPLTALQTGSIGAAIAAEIPAGSTEPAVTGSLAQISVKAVVGGVTNDGLASVAGVFAFNPGVQVASYQTVALDLGNLAVGGSNADILNTTIPTIVASFAAQAALAENTSATSTTGLIAFLKKMVQAYPENAADILGAAINVTQTYGASTVSPTTLKADVYADLDTATYLTPLYDMDLYKGSGPFLADYVSSSASQTLTLEKGTLLTLLGTASTDAVAGNSRYGTLTPDETPVVPE